VLLVFSSSVDTSIAIIVGIGGTCFQATVPADDGLHFTLILKEKKIDLLSLSSVQVLFIFRLNRQ